MLNVASEILSNHVRQDVDSAGGVSRQCLEPEKSKYTFSPRPAADTRYALIQSDEEVARARESAVPVSTRHDTNYCLKTWQEWATYRNSNSCVQSNSSLHHVPLDPGLADVASLAYWLERFVLEIRKKNSEEYNPNSVHHLVCGILRRVRVNKPGIDFFKDEEFSNFRATLDSEMKRLKRNGIGTSRRQAEPLTDDEEQKLWSEGILGDHSPQALLNSVFYMCGLYFALRSGGEHRVLRLRNPQITLKTAIDSKEYLQYNEDSSKNHQGGLKQRKVAPKVVKHFANTENPSSCFVRLYKLYLSKLPDECLNQDSFYFKPLSKWANSSNVWFTKQPLWHNKLHSMMASMCSKAGITGFKTNHSLRATNATRLYHKGVDEQLIMERTGHRSLEGVRSYKRTDEQQERSISKLLQPMASSLVTKSQCATSTISSTTKIATTTIAGLPELKIQGCSDFTININCSK